MTCAGLEPRGSPVTGVSLLACHAAGSVLGSRQPKGLLCYSFVGRFAVWLSTRRTHRLLWHAELLSVRSQACLTA